MPPGGAGITCKAVRRLAQERRAHSYDQGSDEGCDVVTEVLAVRDRKRIWRELIAVLAVIAASLAGALVGAIAVLVWARVSRAPMRDLGLSAPRRWPRLVAGAIALGIALRLVSKALLMPLLGAPAVIASYQHLTGNAAAVPRMVAVILFAGVAEELLYRGYLFERLRALVGSGRAVLAGSIAISAALFAMAHYRDQGLPGVAQSAVSGLAFASMFACSRNLWWPIIAHITFNLASVALIYWDLEEAAARAVFR